MSSSATEALNQLRYREFQSLIRDLFHEQSYVDENGIRREATAGFNRSQVKCKRVEKFLYVAMHLNIEEEEIISRAQAKSQSYRQALKFLSLEKRRRKKQDPLHQTEQKNAQQRRNQIRVCLTLIHPDDVVWFDNTLQFSLSQCAVFLVPSHDIHLTHPFLEFRVVRPGQYKPFQSPTFRLATRLEQCVPDFVTPDIIKKMTEGEWEIRPGLHNRWRPQHFSDLAGQISIVHTTHGFTIQQVRCLPYILEQYLLQMQ